MKHALLFLDDDQSFLAALKRYFTKVEHDWPIQFFSVPSEALNSLPDYEKTILILDWTMPEMDGLTCAKKAKEAAEKYHSNVHIIMLTGHSGVEETVSAFDEGADDYLSKPVAFSDLKLHIDMGKHILEPTEQPTN